jgi:cytochrome P450 monooxygenase
MNSICQWASYALCTAIILFISNQAIKLFNYNLKRKKLGCGAIPWYSNLNSVFGLDVALCMAKSLKQDYFLVWLNKIHANRPKTFLVNFVGSRFIYTIEPENMKSMSAINWKDFAVGPMRRNNKATHPFADKGVNTVDGEEWKFSRELIKPFFTREAFTNTGRLSRHVDRLLKQFPTDGETFNIQPLIQRWVSHFLISWK